MARLEAAGALILTPPTDDIGTALRVLGGRGLTSVLLEGGATLHRAALDAAVVDEIHVYITPAVLGPRGIEWMGEGRMAWEALEDRRAMWLGEDVLVEGHVHRNR
jgi:diaminohydroxyphosphoribosylaminopyrimidine deaminase / 5-amino-6-(5-phosphoribosylamino)uracil reductase